MSEEAWRPAVAPEDCPGDLVLIAVRGGDEARTFVASPDCHPTGWRWITHSAIGWDPLRTDWTVTHWRPLPAPPSSPEAPRPSSPTDPQA